MFILRDTALMSERQNVTTAVHTAWTEENVYPSNVWRVEFIGVTWGVLISVLPSIMWAAHWHTAVLIMSRIYPDSEGIYSGYYQLFITDFHLRQLRALTRNLY